MSYTLRSAPTWCAEEELTMDEGTLREAVVAERRELAGMLGELTTEQWGAPSLCAGWRVREVVAHITMPFRMSVAQFGLEMAKARGNFDRMADRMARRDTARLSDARLLASLRDNVEHPWRPPGGGTAGALSHDVIHGLDISVALGLPRRPPVERIGLILGSMRDRNVRYFGTDLTGVRLEATDLDWHLGDGEPLRGSARDLLLVICGRRIPAELLEGTQAPRYAGRSAGGGDFS
ncbi:maleylpyruvate isomerase family mycothiol-dependent enzyme [Actinoplanes sp. KI2]|uniref:maleylpyruvate isomerase family mycothiol-dependent enzyme n=1 Tax=Actinoplanes sp. KI2 TaxID=2983315 RepID=UPI0021D5EEB4|nr:maleylpyruvate isomerase family mycothiol-dependent enzyme [Actinoplanes sp. KI2]MCU7730478.1 maleylpyruvate isomerase family mycothiol-dependent enzyme [Actinoplanes sp. KI2]